MAVAAYSSVLSLSRVVDNMRHPSHLRHFPDLTQIIDDLRQKLCFLQDFFEVHSSKINEDLLERVVRKIPRLARDAEILIDNFVVDQLHRELEYLQHDDDADGRSCSIESFHGEITQAMQEIEQINGALQTLTNTAQQDHEQPRKSDLRPLTWSGGEKCKWVGLDDQVGQVLEKLTGNQTNLVILPMVGMGGIGKTTLARSVFDHPYNKDRFQVRIWLTISQDYSVKNVFEALLNEDKSWDLFCVKAFERGGRSLELEEIGREISKRCRGLPLMLVVVGGLLSNSDMTIQRWRHVAENMNSVVSSEKDEYCSRILSSSYEHLPIHLKVCFLYTRHTKEDEWIEASRLIRTWVAQGFVKPMSVKSLEEAARKYLEDLVGRNMFFVRARGRGGNTEVCGVHDLLRDLSIRESDKERFLELPKTVVLPYVSIIQKSVCVICGDRKWDTTTFSCNVKMSVCGCNFPVSRLRSVKAVKIGFQKIRLLTTYRYIALNRLDRAVALSTKICLFWNLEILIIWGRYLVLPKELWEMPRLVHVDVSAGSKLANPARTESDVVVLQNLQTLGQVLNFRFTEEIVRRTPNLRELRVMYDRWSGRDWPHIYLQNLARLRKLEQLLVYCDKASIVDIKKYNFFPCSLKELYLIGCKIDGWDSMTIIGSLPNLQLLELLEDVVLGEEWNPIEGQLLKLKELRLWGLNLVRWRADETHFPALEDLRLESMKYLEAIPREFGGLNALKSITVSECPDSVVDSVRVIEEEQLSNGNEELVVHVLSED